MWFEFFIVGGFWFWALISLAVVLLWAAMDHDSGRFATIVALAVAGVLALFGNFNVFKWLCHNPLTALIGVATYFFLGSCWAFARWWYFCHDVRSSYNEMKGKFMAAHNLKGDTIPDDAKSDWKNYFKNYADHYFSQSLDGYISIDSFPLRVSNYKGRIMTWTGYWPFSITWMVCDDLVKKIIKGIYNAMQARLQAISNSAFAGVEKDQFN